MMTKWSLATSKFIGALWVRCAMLVMNFPQRCVLESFMFACMHAVKTSGSWHHGSTPYGKFKVQTSNGENKKCSMKFPEKELTIPQ